ncbi:molybdate ABC transporter substrate-binding protein [Leucobacter chromiiresistens]|uniref:Molybdate ABC transporter substrate-binding protein ModA n=1 Tax=Leucobacter chromiiresistens TaxID=1079994 RepID=A0A147EQZ9_9MICO|nr:molybdate ABC transporter substrate-binding protein [Leucobacter chromiiresistens]KTR86814.1 molybdate ABC transporter substrate-binding protein ModA [Leucobacter chromiiresistens]
MTEAVRDRFRRAGAAGIALALLALMGCGTAPAEKEAVGDGAGSQLSGSLTIAAAASLQEVVTEVADDFTAEHPDVDIRALTFDGSSVLAAQIVAGAPVDVFASADAATMQRVADAGLLAADPTPFATSTLQIAVAPGNPLGIDSLADLGSGGAAGPTPTVVLCAAEVPCGAAARALLDRDGVEVQAASEEQNVTAVLTKVASGEADAGLVYRSDVLRSAGEVAGVEIPGAESASGEYLIAPIEGSASAAAAREFARFLLTDAAQERLRKLGFGPVPGA